MGNVKLCKYLAKGMEIPSGFGFHLKTLRESTVSYLINSIESDV